MLVSTQTLMFAVLLPGFSLINDTDFDLKSEKTMRRLGMRSLGSGVLALGWYMWSPFVLGWDGRK
jgi:hypothetical protein